MERFGVVMSREFHMTDDSDFFVASQRYVQEGKDPRDPQVLTALNTRNVWVLHEGKTLFQFNSSWDDPPEFVVPYVKTKHRYFERARFFRAVVRNIVGFTEQKVIMTIIPPGCVTGNSLLAETQPQLRPNSRCLAFLAVCNSLCFDWLAHLRVDKNLNAFILRALPFPKDIQIRFLSRSALRLTAVNESYSPLWQEQLGDAWREERALLSWPALAGSDLRWMVRAAIDAVIAHAYGLTSEQYEHILATFSHSSYLETPKLCLARFDEIQEMGLEAFTKKYDPYWDIPLNESLPKPVIDLPIAVQQAGLNQTYAMNIEEETP